MLKKEWRKEMKQRIALLTEAERVSLSEKLFAAVEQMPEFQKAKYVLLYWSLPDEPISHQLVERWKDKNLIFPAVVGDQIELRRYCFEADVRMGAFHIMEPIGPPFVDYDALDLALIPGLSFDSEGYRLGRGKGYYDRLLPKLKCTTVGICFPCQYEEQLPHDNWDVPVKKVMHI
ncbi:MAG: 5-formyltetrahydrofolate cyclo-ligase [Paludibacteraceae bacterium]|jgi:5-formyltetrahydrofolate cyclo-ligase|nr:5-formyltetrahydrofolate cyclo-ligase [Paludibacteraceae bacterium]HOI26870.1 5-formyltetrahydrofolate cyclo-ligase [Paludibacteraceae bacterium]HOU67983.1 5-formyltetrahydrofolate cyclo-ligase [Paludibacteraceae bacterium]HPH63548.1 5-formyltetrahydrofolate cyclo-ligase [Paludibacteraceae bacterium]HQF49882.1 5-formyltetrahydrofolate cyclo-ligase [Paludibacteraceae bacterium]